MRRSKTSFLKLLIIIVIGIVVISYFKKNRLFILLVIRCPSPPIPANGVKTGCRDPLSERYGTICSFSCNVGYNPTGSTRRQCLENKTWSGTTPSCQGEERLSVERLFCTKWGDKKTSWYHRLNDIINYHWQFLVPLSCAISLYSPLWCYSTEGWPSF